MNVSTTYAKTAESKGVQCYMSKQDCENELNNLFEQARASFRATAECRLLEEKRRQLEETCRQMLSPQEQACAQKVIDLLVEEMEQEGEYLYKKGHQDCICRLAAINLF